MPIQTDDELGALPKESPLPRSSAHDRKVRVEMLKRANQGPQSEPGEKEYLDDLFERMKLWR